jgi:hypothetical protein
MLLLTPPGYSIYKYVQPENALFLPLTLEIEDNRKKEQILYTSTELIFKASLPHCSKEHQQMASAI